MSDVSTPTRKISREGIVLIKSFEGFRPRAVQRAEGGWIIGYGHTLSAREGASVSEADAELLLRYDLLPIEKTVNTAAPAVLNQHQFDALVSFGFSVGRDRFETSDVLTRLSSGATAEAAKAMMAWPATDVPSAGLRRRAAERALFGADPSRAISLAELLTAPVPQEVPAAATASAQESTLAPESDLSAAPGVEAESAEIAVDDPTAPEPTDSRSAALAALLGEPEPAPEPEPIVPSFTTAQTEDAPPIVAADAEPETVQTHGDEIAVQPAVLMEVAPVERLAANDLEASDDAEGPTPAPEDITDDTATVEAELVAAPGAAGDTTSPAPAPAETPPVPDLPAVNIQRYAPYGTPIIGPLPFLQPATQQNEEPATAPVAFETPQASEALVLTAPEDTPPAVIARPAWTADERHEAETVAQPEAGLFGDDLSLTQGGQPLGRPDFEATAPEGFDWSETGAFIIMGAVGLTAFGASMAAFRLASEQGGGDETSIIGWVLAVIGVACVGVSSLNLYRRFGLPGGDR